MSKIALSPNAGGTATFTIASPGTSTDRTLNLPDAGGTVFVSGQALSATTGSFSGDVTLGSSVLATPTGSAPAYLCRAWVSFDGTTTTPAIRASGNVSSVTRNGTGDYTVNFTTAMPDTNFSAQASVGNNIGDFAEIVSNIKNRGVTSIRVENVRANAVINSLYVDVAIFR